MNVVACVLLPFSLPPFTACACSLFEAPRRRWFPTEGRPGSRADSAPGERISVPRCRLLHHTAVSFVGHLASYFF